MNRIELTKPYLFFTAFLVVSISIVTFFETPSYLIPVFILFSCTLFWLYINSLRSFSDKDENLIGSGNFILNEELKESLNIEKILEAIPSPLILVDQQGKITFANANSELLLPKILKVGNHISSTFRSPIFLETLEKVLTKNENIKLNFDANTPILKHIEVHFVQLPLDSYSRTGGTILMSLVDQSESKMVDQMRSDFVSNASHELRTPLSSIIGFIETIKGHAKSDKENRELFLSLMHDQAIRMQRLVDDLLSLSKLELQEKSPPLKTCNVNKIINKITESFLPLAKKYKVKLINNLPSNITNIIGDETQIHQLFSNLIENSLKYSGEKSTVKVELIKKQKHIKIKNNMIGIQIVDNGKGIPAEHIYRLTERFYRVNEDLSKQRQGTGLGLSIVKHILNRHQGELIIEFLRIIKSVPRFMQDITASPYNNFGSCVTL